MFHDQLQIHINFFLTPITKCLTLCLCKFRCSLTNIIFPFLSKAYNLRFSVMLFEIYNALVLQFSHCGVNRLLADAGFFLSIIEETFFTIDVKHIKNKQNTVRYPKSQCCLMIQRINLFGQAVYSVNFIMKFIWHIFYPFKV